MSNFDPQLYLLIDCKKRDSKINPGAILYTITWIDLDTYEIHTSSIDTSYKNYKRSHWDLVVKNNVQWGIYTGLKVSMRENSVGHRVINADSMPTLQYMFFTQNDAIAFMEDLIDSRQESEDFKSTFHSLFE